MFNSYQNKVNWYYKALCIVEVIKNQTLCRMKLNNVSLIIIIEVTNFVTSSVLGEKGLTFHASRISKLI